MSLLIFFRDAVSPAVGLVQIDRPTDSLADIAFPASLGMQPLAIIFYQLQFRKEWRFSGIDPPDISNNTGMLSSHFYLRVQMNLQ